mgnify:FL=1
MTFQGFHPQDFETFQIEGLEARMQAIQERIQPKFRQIGPYVTEELSLMLQKEMYLHIAKHARRTKNPPNDTWLAVADNKRGYKKHPHFEIGLFDSHVFIWLAYIYELPEKESIAEKFMENKHLITSLPHSFVLSIDHTKKDVLPLKEETIESALTRFRDVKKGEFLLGQTFDKDEPLLSRGEDFLHEAIVTFEKLVPLYELSLEG